MQLDRLHGRDSHNFVTCCIVGFEHGVEDPFEEADFLGRMDSR